MGKKIVLGLSTLAILAAVLFATGIIKVMTLEEAISRKDFQANSLREAKGEIAISVNSTVVDSADLDDIRKLVSAGEYQQALKKHIWFHQESKASSGMAGVRLSYALSSWLALGEKYSPAMDALIALKDENRDLLLSGKGGFGAFHDLSAINSTLENDSETVELFLVLDREFPKQAEVYYHVVENSLIKEEYYDVVRQYIGDPVFKYEELRHTRERSLSLAKSYPELSRPSTNNALFLEGVLTLIKTSLRIGDMDSALEIQSRALGYFEHKKIRNAIPK